MALVGDDGNWEVSLVGGSGSLKSVLCPCYFLSVSLLPGFHEVSSPYHMLLPYDILPHLSPKAMEPAGHGLNGEPK
jgi:hypothetical protein